MASYDVTALGTALEFDTTNADFSSVVKLPGLDRIVVAWSQSTSILYVQCFNVNPTTGAITAIGSPVDIETGTGLGGGHSLVVIDASNLAIFWCGQSVDGFTQLLSVDGTGNITTNGSAVEYDTTNAEFPDAILWDSTHILNSWIRAGVVYTAIFSFNTGTGVIALVGSPLTGGTRTGNATSSTVKLSATHAIIFYSGESADGFCRVLAVNNSTFAVTNAGAEFEYLNYSTIIGNSAVLLSTSPMVVANAWSNSSVATSIQTFSINTSTWAITALGTKIDVSAVAIFRTPTINIIDEEHIIMFNVGTDMDGFANSINYNPSDGVLTVLDTIEFDIADFGDASSCEFSEGKFICAWAGLNGDGYAQVFDIELASLSTGNFFQFF